MKLEDLENRAGGDFKYLFVQVLEKDDAEFGEKKPVVLQ